MSTAAIRTVSKAEFEQMLVDYREALKNPEVTEVFVAMCGSREIAEAFTNPKGVGISEFSRIMNLPITTVRHYVEMGLVSPIELHGKFRFMVFNVPEVESVRQWRDLGLSLEEIAERRRGLGEGILPKEVMNNTIPSLDNTSDIPIMQMHIQNPEERAKSKKESDSRRKRGEPGIVLEKHEKGAMIPGINTDYKSLQKELTLEYSAALQKLEQKKLELERRIAKAKLMTQKLKTPSEPAIKLAQR